ncbi:unnamed protein product, partial [Effrenium voratum]
LPKHGSLRKCLPRISRTVKKNKACFLGPAPSLAPQPIFCPSSARDRPFCINGTRLRTRLAGPRGLLCGPGVPGPSHLGSHRGGGWPGGGHRGGAGAFGGAAAGPRLRQRGGHVAELAGGRHLPGADLRRGLRGGLGQPPHQAPHGGEGRGGLHEVSGLATVQEPRPVEHGALGGSRRSSRLDWIRGMGVFSSEPERARG